MKALVDCAAAPEYGVRRMSTLAAWWQSSQLKRFRDLVFVHRLARWALEVVAACVLGLSRPTFRRNPTLRRVTIMCDPKGGERKDYRGVHFSRIHKCDPL